MSTMWPFWVPATSSWVCGCAARDTTGGETSGIRTTDDSASDADAAMTSLQVKYVAENKYQQAECAMSAVLLESAASLYRSQDDAKQTFQQGSVILKSTIMRPTKRLLVAQKEGTYSSLSRARRDLR